MPNNNLNCPQCQSNRVSKNGKIHKVKPNYKFVNRGRQFVNNRTKKYITEGTKQIIESLFIRKNISSWNSSCN